MARLEIRKKGNRNFVHIYEGYNLSFSDLRISFNGITQNVLITRENGAFVIKREGFNVLNISVYDETGAGTEETFTDVNVLMQRLISLNYIAFSPSITPPIDPFPFQHQVLGKAQLELSATGTITPDFANNTTIRIKQTAAVTLNNPTLPTLEAGETTTHFYSLVLNGFAISLPLDLTSRMVGMDIDDLNAEYWIVSTFLREDASTIIQSANITKL